MLFELMYMLLSVPVKNKIGINAKLKHWLDELLLKYLRF